MVAPVLPPVCSAASCHYSSASFRAGDAMVVHLLKPLAVSRFRHNFLLTALLKGWRDPILVIHRALADAGESGPVLFYTVRAATL
jgi:hypothetical protein